MNNLEQTPNKISITMIVIIICAVLSAVVIWHFISQEDVSVVSPEPVIKTPPVEIVEEPQAIIVDIEDEVIPVEELPKEKTIPLPTLDESDLWLQKNMPSLTWRQELLQLVIDEDMIRRFVVFTDNFAKGILAYEHSPLVLPQTPFSANESKDPLNSIVSTLTWNEDSTDRFSLYVDLLRSIDSDLLVQWYIDLKPLIDQAFLELGYPEEEFTDILQASITRVLDMELPKEPLELTRPSVMYKFKNPEIEALDESDKLLLRIGKENLLVIKSVLLEINEKLSRKQTQ